MITNKLLAILLAATVCMPVSTLADEDRFFPDSGTHFGVYYYPEHWAEEQWSRDIQRVAELGFDLFIAWLKNKYGTIDALNAAWGAAFWSYTLNDFDLPPDVFAHYRQGLWLAVNYTDQDVTIPVPKNATVLMGDRELPPAGVLVWRP